ncbi:MAG: condensation domain-containing protein, partial [Psychrosphaera sp.]|nr:condensation domain-containing protein [Psychrosphaera sp.]
MVLDVLPLTPGGKLDRKALPVPGESDRQTAVYVGPTNDVEQKLCDIWQQLLGLEKVGIEDNFFDLGGHSILATRVISEIREQFAVELPLRTLFEQPTIAGLALEVTSHDTGSVLPEILPVARAGRESQSFAQQRLWFIDNLQGGSPEYNMPMSFEVKGQLDIALLTAVFTTIIERHQVLRTVYLDEQGQALQRIQPMRDVDFKIKVVDLSQLAGEALSAQVNQQVKVEMSQPFNLTTDIMLRVSYVKKTPDSGVMIFNVHHIASDGWSMEVLIKEFFTLGQAYSQGQANPLTELAFQYADYAHWQREFLAGSVLESQFNYWQQQLADIPTRHSLPLDHVRPAVKQFEGGVVTGELPAAVAKQLLLVAKQHRLTPFMLLHGALSLVLA